MRVLCTYVTDYVENCMHLLWIHFDSIFGRVLDGNGQGYSLRIETGTIAKGNFRCSRILT
jgi:hypothetical protein